MYTLEGHRNWVLCVAWSPDANVIATGSMDNTVRILRYITYWRYDYGILKLERLTVMRWEVIQNGLLRSLGSHCICTRFSFVANSRVSGREDCRIASASKDTTIKVWDIISHRPIFTLSGHTAAVTCLRWGGKNWLYSGSQDKSVRIWDAKDVRDLSSSISSLKLICVRGNYYIFYLLMHIGWTQCPYQQILYYEQDPLIIQEVFPRLLKKVPKRHWKDIEKQGDLLEVIRNVWFLEAMTSQCFYGIQRNPQNQLLD